MSKNRSRRFCWSKTTPETPVCSARCSTSRARTSTAVDARGVHGRGREASRGACGRHHPARPGVARCARTGSGAAGPRRRAPRPAGGADGPGRRVAGRASLAGRRARLSHQGPDRARAGFCGPCAMPSSARPWKRRCSWKRNAPRSRSTASATPWFARTSREISPSSMSSRKK